VAVRQALGEHGGSAGTPFGRADAPGVLFELVRLGELAIPNAKPSDRRYRMTAAARNAAQHRIIAA
jgi:hypothetical protein